MNLKPFLIEKYYAKHEFTAKYMLSSSDAESRSITELLAFEPEAREKLEALHLGYTESNGAPELRHAIAEIYQNITQDQVLVLSSAEEGIFIFYNALFNNEDHLIIETPCYQSGLELARATNAEVSTWERHYEDAWTHDLERLKKLIRPNTKAIYLNTPSNPTGINIPHETFQAIIEIAKEHKIIIFCDEVYRELEHDPQNQLPAICEVYEHGVSLGSMSKSYGLPGLRLGWLITQNHALLEKFLDFKFYTTICASAPSEFLSALALRNRHFLLERNLNIVHHNLPLLQNFIERHQTLFSWVKPNASPIGFPRVHGIQNVREFCEEIVTQTSVLLLPGDVYEQPQHLRISYGRANMPIALGILDDYLAKRN
jgi:aspartate/methionine/tyrosine aminotransferase